jgi:DNA invertase Pin-like site-specific DNA recombinase
VYVDNDTSAYSGRRRPEFENMLDAMKNNQFDRLLCWHTDRLYRSMKDLERLIEVAEAQHVAIRTVQGGDLDLITSAGRMVARILGSVARQQSEHMSERRISANEQKAQRGKWQTANRAFGYTWQGEPLEPEASAVRKAALEVLAGKSIQGVAREWNAAGLKTTMAGKVHTDPHSKEKFTIEGKWEWAKCAPPADEPPSRRPQGPPGQGGERRQGQRRQGRLDTANRRRHSQGTGISPVKPKPREMQQL